MFKYLLLPFLLISSFTMFGQMEQLKVKYEETIHFEVPEHLKNNNREIPTSNLLKKVLLINENQANYIFNKEDTEEPKDELNGKRRRFWRMNKQEDILFQDLDNNLILEKIDLFGKDFVVKEEIVQHKWKLIATEQRDILGYTCMKAEFQDSTNLITAWFTPQISKSFGPAGYGGLPGLILAISIGEDRIILAKAIDKEPSSFEIITPNSKNTVDRKEFEKIREEKIEERKAMWGGRRGH